MTKNNIYEDISLEPGRNEKANMFEEKILNMDYDASLMSQRIAVAKDPSGLIKLNNVNKKDHF